MNRLLISASKSVPPTLRIYPGTRSSSALRVLTSRHFSDSTADSTDITTGTVKRFDFKKAFGFIIPDGVDKFKHVDSDLVFVHRSNIKTVKLDGKDAFPSLIRGQRVQFKLAPPDEGKTANKALEVVMEGGELVPPHHPKYLENFERSEKARFGDVVFEIFTTSTTQTELETRIVAEYDKVKASIESMTAKVERGKKAAEGQNDSE